MTKETQHAIEIARLNLSNGISNVAGFADMVLILDFAKELERLTFALHCCRQHPDFEYATTQTARKSGDDPRVGLDGDGWEPNDIVPHHNYKDGEIVEKYWRNWERFQFHEDNYWRRRRTSGKDVSCVT